MFRLCVIVCVFMICGTALFVGSAVADDQPGVKADAQPKAKVDAKPKIPDLVYVKISTSLGDMHIELNQLKAPITVKNFLDYTDDGFYNGLMFQRVRKGFMIQGGGVLPDYTARKTREPIKNEADNGLKNERGTIAMARTSVPNSATSQFFINLVDNGRTLNHKSPSPRGWGYCVFGKVIQGMDTLDKIGNTPVKKDPRADGSAPAAPITPVIINKVERVDPAQIKDVIAAARAAEAEEAKKIELAKKMQAEAGKLEMEKGIEYVKGKDVDVSKGTTSASGLWQVHVTEGTGELPKPTDKVKVHYTGWLTDGSKFDSSVDRGQPSSFGLNQVIKGWTEGVGTMKVGGKSFLVIPPDLAYGERGRPKIPGNSVLVFEIELLGINE